MENRSTIRRTIVMVGVVATFHMGLQGYCGSLLRDYETRDKIHSVTSQFPVIADQLSRQRRGQRRAAPAATPVPRRVSTLNEGARSSAAGFNRLLSYPMQLVAPVAEQGGVLQVLNSIAVGLLVSIILLLHSLLFASTPESRVGRLLEGSVEQEKSLRAELSDPPFLKWARLFKTLEGYRYGSVLILAFFYFFVWRWLEFFAVMSAQLPGMPSSLPLVVSVLRQPLAAQLMPSNPSLAELIVIGGANSIVVSFALVLVFRGFKLALDRGRPVPTSLDAARRDRRLERRGRVAEGLLWIVLATAAYSTFQVMLELQRSELAPLFVRYPLGLVLPLSGAALGRLNALLTAILLYLLRCAVLRRFGH